MVSKNLIKTILSIASRQFLLSTLAFRCTYSLELPIHINVFDQSDHIDMTN